MEIRKLTTVEERFQAALSCNLAFGGRRSMAEIRRSVEENPSAHDAWGCFAEDGKLMAHVQNQRRHSRFDGNDVLTGCIGGVSTFPEYREGGAVRQIFGRLFADAYQSGEVFSYLFPFNHGFYRKFGYETCCALPLYRFPVSALKGRRFTGWAKLWLPGDDVSAHTAIYARFMKRYNMAHVRTEEMMKERISSDPFETRRYTYLLGNSAACAYVSFSHKRKNDRSAIDVQDCAWLGKEGLDAILGFLARYTADYDDVCFRMPGDIKLAALIPDAYALSESELQSGYMARVINVKSSLALVKKPAGTHFTIEVDDPLIPENAGIWRVTDAAVERCSDAPDVSVSATALAPMLLGFMPLSLAELRDDVKVRANRDALAAIFTEKPLYIAPADHF